MMTRYLESIGQERNEADDGDGAVRCYTADTMILGSQHFLEAMGAKEIRTFARKAPGPESFSMERFLPEHRSVRRVTW